MEVNDIGWILVTILVSIFVGYSIGSISQEECTDCNVVKNIPDCNCECEQLECEQSDCVQETYKKQQDLKDMEKIFELE